MDLEFVKINSTEHNRIQLFSKLLNEKKEKFSYLYQVTTELQGKGVLSIIFDILKEILTKEYRKILKSIFITI